jgi:hypothetical protein
MCSSCGVRASYSAYQQAICKGRGICQICGKKKRVFLAGFMHSLFLVVYNVGPEGCSPVACTVFQHFVLVSECMAFCPDWRNRCSKWNAHELGVCAIRCGEMLLHLFLTTVLLAQNVVELCSVAGMCMLPALGLLKGYCTCRTKLVLAVLFKRPLVHGRSIYLEQALLVIVQS